MYGNGKQPLQSAARRITTGNEKLQALLGELSDNEEMDLSPGPSQENTRDPLKPWLQGFHQYLNTHENLGELSVVQWWGINSLRYPVWGSIACNSLSIMATSISCKRAFSSAGITISKRWNRLKPDIVEALQCLKCLIKHDLLFHEDPMVISEIQDMDRTSSVAAQTGEEPGDGWDELIEDLDDTEAQVVDDDDMVEISFVDGL